MRKSIQLVIFLCLQLHFTTCFFFQIHNNMTDVLINRNGGDLLVHFDFSGHPLIKTASDVSLMTSFGLAVNGSVCERFMGGLEDITLVVTATCLPSESFWFSIMAFTDNGMTLSSTALYIPRVEVPVVSMSSQQEMANPEGQHQWQVEEEQQQQSDEQITLVLPLTFNDVTRSFVLLDSLHLLDNPPPHSSTSTVPLVREMIIMVPPAELAAVQSLLWRVSQSLPFPVRIVSERELLDPHHIHTTGSYPYAIQMALKLLVSEWITTPFYLTLDADVVLLRTIKYRDMVDNQGRALYEHEARLQVHPLWWSGSERYLLGEVAEEEREKGAQGEMKVAGEGGMPRKSPLHPTPEEQQGFGVTPALLSTYGARLTIQKLELESAASLYEQPLGAWVHQFGREGVVWSEYTLYAVTLHHYQVG